jgi:Flp pilus assembly protein protease CpaA
VAGVAGDPPAELEVIRRRDLASLGGLTGALALFAAVVAQSAVAATTQMFDGFSGSDTLTQSDVNQLVGRQLWAEALTQLVGPAIVATAIAAVATLVVLVLRSRQGSAVVPATRLREHAR